MSSPLKAALWTYALILPPIILVLALTAYANNTPWWLLLGLIPGYWAYVLGKIFESGGKS